ncbi:gamma-aminobutyric acid type B receptor subunit 1 isoform X1 [Ostrinia furnacalis]|uniref:gamma-aminobutyric acid type B receptor subunit 1 isoform X1 n=1 Tax=Ostrinia furnacalis TaxID=93504 RepID=UPI00103BB3F4|nr:gamma-aminobutyric acid type B receptor subunit 1 isoform X1 [Ostrinia furnacalis]
MPEVTNDSMSPPRAMTLRAGRGGAAAAAAAPPPTMPYCIENSTLIRLCLQFLWVISHIYQNASIPRVRANLNFLKRPLVKLKANEFSFRTRTVLCDVKSLLVKTLVQLFVVAKWVVRGWSGRRGTGRARALLLLWLAGCGSSSEGRRDNDLHIGGIFPMEGEGGWQGGQACKPAAELALADVNARSDLLSGFKLLLHSNDSKCEPGLGASVMYNLLYNPPQKLLLLAGCSTVCTTVAEAAKMWNLMVLCYGASSPALSDRARFPTLFRTHPSATVHNPTRIKLMQKFGWSRIAILQQAEEVFISTVEDLEAHCKKASIEIVTRQSFLSDPADAVRNLRRQDARVIVGLFYVVAARRVLCEVYKHRLYGKSYVWFFIGWYEDNWFETNLEREGIECTVEQMREAAEGHLTTEALMWNQNANQTTISGMTSEDFRSRLNEALREAGYDIDGERYPEGYQEAPLAYDAVWAVALAFNKTMEKLEKSGLSLKNFTYTNKKIADDIYEAINSTSFLGVSGLVAFSSQGDRIALTQIEQLADNHYVKLGYYDTQADNLTWLDRERWVGGKVPPDRTVVVNELRTVSLPLFACMTALCIAGILAAIALIVFNILHRHRRVIQWSHPACNTVMLCGCCICLGAAVALGVDGRWVQPQHFAGLCAARAWLLATGFSMAYGAMFTKVWRVHRHTTKPKPDTKKRMHGWKLYTMVGGLLVVDAALLTAWQLRDPLQRRVEIFPLEAPRHHDDDVHIRPELEHCESEHNTVWLGVMYGYKGLVLVFGLFLAYETRSVKVRQINDSRYVGMSIYNVVVLCLITAPVTLVIASQQDAAFAFVSLAIVFCCFLSMALIFIPKVIEVIRHPTERAESGRGSGSGSAPADEERYRELVKENEELQKLIAQKEERIRVLKQKLAEREAAAADGVTQGTGGGGGVLADLATATSDYGTSTNYTRSSRASVSDLDFSESYL